jgi:Rho-binding antiterminator
MSNLEKTYKPIDCDYYDRLEAWATTQTECSIVFKDEDDKQQEISAKIEDVYTKDKIEYLKTDTGDVIRLDALLSVNDIPLPR